MTALRSPFSAGFTDRAADDLAATLKAISSPNRLKILALLRSHGALTAVQLEERLGGISQPTVAHHLGHLQRAGLITGTKDEQRIWRRLNRDAFTQLALLLDPDGAQ
jgi:DNA-binding transcriptional ArsR family regulator